MRWSKKSSSFNHTKRCSRDLHRAIKIYTARQILILIEIVFPSVGRKYVLQESSERLWLTASLFQTSGKDSNFEPNNFYGYAFEFWKIFKPSKTIRFVQKWRTRINSLKIRSKFPAFRDTPIFSLLQFWQKKCSSKFN